LFAAGIEVEGAIRAMREGRSNVRGSGGGGGGGGGCCCYCFVGESWKMLSVLVLVFGVWCLEGDRRGVSGLESQSQVDY
jgi:hypothetical protein